MNWEITASVGGRIVRRLTFTNNDGGLINTAGWTFKASVRGIPLTVVHNSAGVIDVIVTSAQTIALGVGVYSLGVDWTDALGNPPEQEIKAVLRIERDMAL